jgi:peptide/nickel transport system substrate-binding protein
LDENEQRLDAARIVQESLAECGVQVSLYSASAEEVYAPGPQGPVFGRLFSAAVFAWPSSIEPPCYLYKTDEIPGPYPDYPRGWGGANASGYSSPDFDISCTQALNTLTDDPIHSAAHAQAQAIFAEDLPALPLFEHWQWTASRPDLCGLRPSFSTGSSLWNLSEWGYGEGCP